MYDKNKFNGIHDNINRRILLNLHLKAIELKQIIPQSNTSKRALCHTSQILDISYDSIIAFSRSSSNNLLFMIILQQRK
jgi:hypothetical protein